jgi:hypothetical protein
MSGTHLFAVQALKGDSRASVAKTIFDKARARTIGFAALEFMDEFTVGSHRFLRFRIDVDPSPILNDLLSERGVIGRSGSYKVRFPSGRTADISHTTMQSEPRALYVFRGTNSKHWERQFADLS